MKSALLAKDLMSLETYAGKRESVHADVTAHRGSRTVRVGRNAMLVFEDEITVQYQIQEALRTESISADESVQAEIDRYAPLIPDGSNLKATLTLEFADEDERSTRIAALAGVEHRVWARVGGSAQIFATADADIGRVDPTKSSAAVHFLRFDLEKPLVRELKQGSPLAIGIEHPAYNASLIVGKGVLQALLKDLR